MNDRKATRPDRAWFHAAEQLCLFLNTETRRRRPLLLVVMSPGAAMPLTL